MALKNCPECEKEVSSEAAACPHCGHPLKKQKKALVSRPAGLVLQLVAVVLFIVAFSKFVGDQADPAGAVVAGIGGLVLLYVGGRTKARVK